MKAPPHRPDPPGPSDLPPARSPRDTLDDIDLQLDAVHELTDVDLTHEAPTHLRPDTRDRTEPLGSREMPTGMAENRTAPWMNATPWVNPDAQPDRKKDPWFLPVFVFVVVLLTCIGVFLYQQLHKHP
jgi:hypothetical protein